MVTDPAVNAVTLPVVPTLAMPAALLLQVPPVAAVLSVCIDPTHIVVAPSIAAGASFTVTIAVCEQPLVV